MLGVLMTEEIKFDIEDVFDPDDYLYFYESSLTEERLGREVEFLVEYTKLDDSMKILDLACGHGRHANSLANLGHSVTGVDITKGFLEIARTSAEELDVQVDYIQGDMRKIAYQECFGRVYLLFTAFGYFDDSENKQVLQRVYDALMPGGMLCFDSHNRDAFLTYHLPSTVCERERNLMVDQHSFDTMTGRCSTRRTTLRNKQVKTCEYSVRFYNPTEIRHLLDEVGFSSCNFYGSWNGSALDNCSRRMIVVAKK